MTNRPALVIDDNRAINKLVKTQLGLLGFQAITCDNIETAKRLLTQRSAFEFILSDINMPGGSGLELAEWIQLSEHDLPLYLMTAQAFNLSTDRLRQLNIHDVLLKPFQIGDLAAMLATDFDDVLAMPPFPNTEVGRTELSYRPK